MDPVGQRIGFGDRSEPCERCCGVGREKNILRNPNYFCLYPIIVFQCGSTAPA